MGIYQRPDSKYWWMYLEGSDGPQRRGKQMRTGVLVASPDSKNLAEQVYQAKMADLARVRVRDTKKTYRDTSLAWSYVYFITDGEMIKIGRALDVSKRLKALQTAHPRPLRVLAAATGHLTLETQLHKRFRRDLVQKEWYRNSPELAAFIEQVRAGMHPAALLAIT